MRVQQAWVFGFALLVTGCDAIVGAECREGFEVIDGSCGRRPPPAATLDGGPHDLGSSPWLAPARSSRSAESDPVALQGADGGTTGQDTGVRAADGSTRPEVVDLRPDAGGRPELHPGGPTRPCQGGTGVCLALCTEPQLSCDERCIDPRHDENNCGACGVRCGADICIAGLCTPPLVGHVVVIGHDFAEPEPTLLRVFGNACQIRHDNPLRIAIFSPSQTSTSADPVWMAVEESAGAVARPWIGFELSEPSIESDLLDAHVLVVSPQVGRSSGELGAIGHTWSEPLRRFLERGGVVVALESSNAPPSAQLLEGAGLGPFGTRVAVAPNSTLLLNAPSDAVARDVPLRFVAIPALLGYDSSSRVVSNGVVSVVVHNTYMPTAFRP